MRSFLTAQIDLGSIGDTIGTVLFGAVTGYFLALLATLALFVLFRKLGLYGRSGDGKGFVRIVVLVISVLFLPILGGISGCARGSFRAAERQLQKGILADTVLPKAGGACADVMFRLDRLLDDKAADGPAELDVARFAKR